MGDRTEWVSKIKSIVAKRTNVSEGGSLMRQSHSDGSLVSVSKKDGSLVSRKLCLSILSKSCLMPGLFKLWSTSVSFLGIFRKKKF
jgi:hypothetical protein